MNEHTKIELENLKKEAREFKTSLAHVLVGLFIFFVAGITIWQIWELFKIFFIENIGETVQTIFGIIFWIVVAFVAIAIKNWWNERQNKKMWEEISNELHKEKQSEEKSEEMQVIFFNKTPKETKPK